MRPASLHQEVGWGLVLWVLVGGAIGNAVIWLAGLIILGVAWLGTR